MKTNRKDAESIHFPQLSHMCERGHMRFTLVTVLLLFFVAGLATNSKAQSITYEQARMQHPDWVEAPGGLIRPDCVHEIPKGAAVELQDDGSGDVRLEGEIIAHYDPCPEASIAPPSLGNNSDELTKNPDSSSGLNGWLLFANATFNLKAGDNVDYLVGQWTVPPLPAQTGGLVYLFNGIQPWQNYKIIMQPVLQYGYNGKIGGNYWTMASWLWTPTNFYISPSNIVYPGDTILGLINMLPPQGNDNEWAVSVEDDNQNIEDVLEVWSSKTAYQFKRADAAVLEVYHLSYCNQLPAGSVTFTNNAATHGYPSYMLLPASAYGAGLTKYALSYGDPCGIGAWTNGTTSILTF
jgi:hypothetical protein